MPRYYPRLAQDFPMARLQTFHLFLAIPLRSLEGCLGDVLGTLPCSLTCKPGICRLITRCVKRTGEGYTQPRELNRKYTLLLS